MAIAGYIMKAIGVIVLTGIFYPAAEVAGAFIGSLLDDSKDGTIKDRLCHFFYFLFPVVFAFLLACGAIWIFSGDVYDDYECVLQGPVELC